MGDIYHLELTVPGDQEEELISYLPDLVSWGWEEKSTSRGDLIISIYCPSHEQAQQLSNRLQSNFTKVQAKIESRESRVWKESWREFFRPKVVAEKFLVLPPWLKQKKQGSTYIPLIINPQMAFGTGHHATTILCLEAIVKLFEQSIIDRQSICLDVGTGSGILAIACCLLSMQVVGLDQDVSAVHNAAENKKLNQVGDKFSIFAGTEDCLKIVPKFDLILANILAGNLIQMAPVLTGLLDRSGYLVLSGILFHQEDPVIESYHGQGLVDSFVMRREEWSALILSSKTKAEE